MIERVRARSEGPAPIIIMLTSQGQREDAQRCRLLGVGSYLVKPIRLHELREALLKLLEPAGISNPHSDAPLSTRESVRHASLNILVAEDNAVNQLVMKRLLNKRGHRVTMVADGHSAVAAVAAGNFDVILMDVQMPELDGLQATREIRANEAGTGRRIPIVALTAHAMQSDQERCLESGMDAYLTKPINTSELDRLLNAYAAHRVDSDTADLAG